MVLRISLIVTIVACLISAYIGHFKVVPRINELQGSLSQTRQELMTIQQREAQARRQAQENKDLADQLQLQLDQTKEQLAEAKKLIDQQRKRADKAEEDLNQTRKELTDTLRELAAWKALGISLDTVRTRLAELGEARQMIAALQNENRILLEKLSHLRNRLSIYEGTQEPKVELPEGLKGQVVAMDPKWEFVVINIGRKHGALPGGELLVSRDGKLVGKIRIIRVEEDQSVANILPDWKQTDVKIGDIVLY